jgi:pilus assembly protein CpaB
VATFAPSVAGADRSLLLLQNLLVLAVAQETASRHGPVRELRAYTSVTLAVTPEEATLLVLAEERGSLRLLLRPLGDNTVTAGTIEATTDRFRRSGP